MRSGSAPLFLFAPMPALVLVLVLVPRGDAEAADDVSCSLAGGSHAEATLSPPNGEDEAFLGRTSTGGLPYIAFVIDTSAWMRRFPIDLSSPTVRAQGLGCSNTTLNALTYQANPCVDGKGQFVGYTEAGCSSATAQPAGFAQPYSASRTYAPFDSHLTELFRRDRYYVFDRGWGADSTRVEGTWVRSSASDACLGAGIPTGERSACAACVNGSGYYLPTDPSLPPVLAGNWINFNPPKYVIARKLLKDQFAALDAPSRTRQTMLTMVNDDAARCYSRNLGGAGMDASKDGATLIANPTMFKPPCGQFLACQHNGSSGGGRAAFDNMVNRESELFTSPNSSCPSQVDVPLDAPAGTSAVSFAAQPDAVCRASFVDAMGTPLQEAVCAPYAESLINAGQYLGDLGLYDDMFTHTAPGTWRKRVFDEDDGVCPASSCGCPKPAIILLAGGAPSFDDNLPCEITGNGCPAVEPANAPACGVATSSSANSNLARVARFLAHANIKPTEYYNSPAHVSTHVVAFGTDHPDLSEAARAGKGAFFSAANAQELRSALNEAIAAASTTQFSFSNATVSTVQTRTSSGMLVPRFTPSESSAFWKGRLYQFKAVNEDTCGCTEPVAPGALCDFNGDGACGGVFFQDADGDFIAADATGVFRKARAFNGEFRPGVEEATPIWEASDALQSKTAATGQSASRKILTVVDSSGDGMLDHRDEVISFDEENVETLLPYLNVGTGGFCQDLGTRLGACLGPEQCARRLIQFVRGMDVLDEDCDGDSTDDRPDKLADIFHSSPVLVDPPMSTRSVLCRMGLHSQCLISLTQTPTPQNPASAYDDFVQNHRHRDKVVLVGANGGMLHAFRGGRWIGADNPDTGALNECPSPTDCTGYYDLGDGEELWAFIPPDLLPKLSRLMQGRHEYFVDGTAMVRDIWSDANGNAQKEPDEFRTVAVVSERRGGTHFFALDVTRPEGPEVGSAGFFRWIFPQPNTAAARAAGQSFSEFAPSPPPIGPVRLKTSGPSTGTWQGENYEERWIVMLNGGFDPGLLRGRTVSMVDVWNGQGLWTFDAGAVGFPFAATPGMVGFGNNATNPNRDPNDYFFDTATVGDQGGQLWTLRFNDPDPATWSGARMFQAGAGTSQADGTCSRQPFFQTTANVVAQQGGHLRTLAGTGDRFNIADMGGGTCSVNNLVGCLRRGCTLTQEVTREVCGRTSTFRRDHTATNGATSCAASPDVLTLDPLPGTSCCSADVEVQANYVLSCTNSDGSAVSIRWQPSMRCEAQTASACGSASTEFVCEAQNDTPFDVCATFDRCDEPIAPPPNGFYSVKVFDDVAPGRAPFNGPLAADAYDAQALNTSSLVQIDPYTPSTTRASATDDGWYVSYGQPNPPGHVYPQTPTAFFGNAVDERTSTSAVVVAGCSVFTTTTPGAAAGACQPRSIVTNTTYQLNFLSGSACNGLDEALAARVTHRQATEPASPQQVALDVTPSGTVNLKLTSLPRSSGGSAQTTRVASDLELVKVGYRLPVTRPLHACRHPEGATPADQAANAQAMCDTP